MELQGELPALLAAGIRPVALSYDTQATLAAFAAERGITYPLLADEGSLVIRRLDLLNPTFPPDHARHGVAQPGTFLLDAGGRVLRAAVHADQRVRDTWATSLRGVVGTTTATAGPAERQSTPDFIVTVALDSPHYRPRQRVGLRATIEIAPGLSVVGERATTAAAPLAMEVTAPEGVTVEPVASPTPAPRMLPALGATLPVHTGRIELAAALVFDELREDAVIGVTLVAQACDDRDCAPPRTLTFALPIRFETPL